MDFFPASHEGTYDRDFWGAGFQDVHIPAFFKEVNERGMTRRMPENQGKVGKKADTYR
jgi:hypothetical protein